MEAVYPEPVEALASVSSVEVVKSRSVAVVVSANPRELYGETVVISASRNVWSNKSCVVNSVSAAPEEDKVRS